MLYSLLKGGECLMAERIKVQVIESSALEEAGLRALIGECDSIELVQHHCCSPACNQRCITESPHVLVIELPFNNHKSIDCIRQISVRHPDIKILSVCSSGDSAACKMAMNAGAIGFVSKQIPPQMFIKALHRVAAGKPYVEPWVAKRMIEEDNDSMESSPFDVLSRREHDILLLMLSGESNTLIADKLHISINTLGNHRSHIKRKLGVTNIVELIKLAIHHGVI